MAFDRAAGPAELVMTAAAARRYYVDGASKSDIAAELDVSRFKVARLLDEARASGLVRIEFSYPAEIDVELSERLRLALGLRLAIVVNGSDDDEVALRSGLGRVAADLLTETVGADDVLGLVWARSLLAMRTSLERLAACEVVQLTGALSRPDVDESSVELVRDVARVSGGRAFWFYAPMIVPDAATARAMRTQPEVAGALEAAKRVTKAVVGVGAWAPGLSTVADAVTEAERREAHSLGVRAEIGGIQLGANGEPVRTSLTDRLVGIDAAGLNAVDEVTGIAYGVRKAEAVRAALEGGFLTGLITHGALARALLE